MQTNSTAYTNAINSIKRQTDAYIEVYYNNQVTTPNETVTSDNIVSIEISRAGEQSKFFGFGVSQKATIKLLDRDRELDTIYKGRGVKIYMGVKLEDGTYEYKAFPRMWVTDVQRDETSNSLTITAYDMLETALLHTVDELGIEAPYTIKEFAETTTKYLDGVDRSAEPLNMHLPVDPIVNDYNFSGEVYWSINDSGNVVCNVPSSGFDYMINVDFSTQEGAIKLDTYKKYIFRMEAISGSTMPSQTYPLTVYLGSNTIRWDTPTKEFTLIGYSYVPEITIVQALRTRYIDLELKFSIEEIVEKEVAPLFDNEEAISALSLSYENGANFEGTETLRDALNAIAEATQTIYYMGADDVFHFKRLGNADVAPVKTLSKDIYMSLKTGESFTLGKIVHVTELGDNISAENEYAYLLGGIQYVRNNPFWELRDDIATLVETALEEMAEVGAYQFECEWRGDPSLEPGDVIDFEINIEGGYTKESYLLSDTITYNGGIRQKTDWSYTTPEQVFTNPTNLGDVIKQTYAKVDKQNKEIEIVASESSENKQELAALKINTESISASVEKAEQVNSDAIASLNGELVTLTKKVETSMTAEDVQIQIKSEISNGVDKVTTATGFTFNEEGLTIAKTGSEMTTNIDEDGMSVYRDNQEVLTADNTGVTAYNLTAKTYLIVGENSRFEDFTSTDGEARTGCFWIGG